MIGQHDVWTLQYWGGMGFLFSVLALVPHLGFEDLLDLH